MWLRPQSSRSSLRIAKAFWHGAYQLAAVELMASTLIHPYSEHLSRRLTVLQTGSNTCCLSKPDSLGRLRCPVQSFGKTMVKRWALAKVTEEQSARAETERMDRLVFMRNTPVDHRLGTNKTNFCSRPFSLLVILYIIAI